MFKESGNNIAAKDYRKRAKAIKDTYDDLTDKVPGLYDNSARMRTYFVKQKSLTSGSDGGIIGINSKMVADRTAEKVVSKSTEGIDVHYIGKINKSIYKCVVDDIVTDEVIITDTQIQHIKERHPNDYERYFKYVEEVIASPDYILEANKPKTAFVLKHIDDNNKNYQVILRLKTSDAPENYKNSVITFLKVEEKRYNRYLRTKKILYKRE